MRSERRCRSSGICRSACADVERDDLPRSGINIHNQDFPGLSTISARAALAATAQRSPVRPFPADRVCIGEFLSNAAGLARITRFAAVGSANQRGPDMRHASRHGKAAAGSVDFPGISVFKHRRNGPYLNLNICRGLRA